MLQFVKLVILSLLFVLILPVNQAKSEIGKKIEEEVHSNPNHIGNFQSPNLFTLFNTSGDLTVDISHNTYDKKTFLRLFLHPKYSKIHPAQHNSAFELNCISLSEIPETKDYYVYTLRRILI